MTAETQEWELFQGSSQRHSNFLRNRLQSLDQPDARLAFAHVLGTRGIIQAKLVVASVQLLFSDEIGKVGDDVVSM